jgi:hypothetical protein
MGQLFRVVKDEAGEPCPKCAGKLHRTAAPGAEPSEVPRIVQEVLGSPGERLADATRADMEKRFGQDFGDVRVHTQDRAAESAHAINARAYTVGRHVVFGAGEYAPATGRGRELLAHELVHVLQQGRTDRTPSALTVGPRNDPLEREATEVAGRLSQGAGPAGAPPAPAVQQSSSTAGRIQGFFESPSSDSSGSSSDGGQDAGPVQGPDAGDGGADASSACRIDVRATHIGGILSGAPIWHLFVIYADSSGVEHYFRGGPGGACPGVTDGYGTIKTTTGVYAPGTVDWDPSAPSVTVMSGSAACGKDACLAAKLSRIDGTCTPYAPTGPNSNTTAKTILLNCGVPLAQPVTIAPGWGDPAL